MVLTMVSEVRWLGNAEMSSRLLLPSHPYYYRRRMQLSLQDLTKISPCVRNSTPIVAEICLRLNIACPLPLDGSLFAFILCFFTEIRV